MNENHWLALGATAGIFAGIALHPVIAVPVAGALGVGAVAWASTAIACGVVLASTGIGAVTGAVIGYLNQSSEETQSGGSTREQGEQLAPNNATTTPFRLSRDPAQGGSALSPVAGGYSSLQGSQKATSTLSQRKVVPNRPPPLNKLTTIMEEDYTSESPLDKPQVDEAKLTLAILNGDADAVSKLIAEGANVNERNIDLYYPLALAILNGDADAVSKLIAEGANVNEHNIDLYYPLELAVQHGHAEIVATLIEAGAAVNQKNRFDKTALMIAAYYGRAEIFATLIEAGADVNQKDVFDNTALIIAAQYGNDAVVKALIEKGADVNAVNEKGETALMFAAQYGNDAVVKVLIDANADVNAVNLKGNTALMFADQYGNDKVVKFLIEKGADVTAVDRNDNNANKTPPTTSCFTKTFSCLSPFLKTK